jgi:hypothetical protein
MTTEVLTLQDYAGSPKALVAGVAKILQEESKFMDMLPFWNAGTLSIKVVQEGTLPSTIGWRRIGADHSSYRATNPSKKEERAYSIGNIIEIDKALIKDKSAKMYDPRAYQVSMITKAIGRVFNDTAINNTELANVDAPVGLKARIANDLPSSQLMFGDSSSSALDLSLDASGRAANIQQFLHMLDKLIWACDGHKASAILCNSTFILLWWDIARQSGMLKTTTDALGREFATYKGVPFIDMGYKVDDSSTIMTNTELTAATADTGGTCSSLIAVKIGKEHFTGWQEYSMEVLHKGYKDSADGLTERTIIDWVIGLALSHPRSAARLGGLQLV